MINVYDHVVFHPFEGNLFISSGDHTWPFTADVHAFHYDN